MSIEFLDENAPTQPVAPVTFGANLPEDASGFLDAPIAPAAPMVEDGGTGFLAGEAGPDPIERKAKRVKLSRRMKKSMDKIKGFGGQALVMWFHDQAQEQPEWELSKEEKEWLEDSFEVLFEVLDIDIEVEPLNWKLTSVWWIIAYPFVVFLSLFLTKRAKVAQDGDSGAKS